MQLYCHVVRTRNFCMNKPVCDHLTVLVHALFNDAWADASYSGGSITAVEDILN